MPELNRSTDLYDTTKPKRLQKHQKMGAPVGPTSSNPGPWLTSIIVDSLLPDPDPSLHDCADEHQPLELSGWALAQYKEAYVALDSFRFKPLYRTVRIPLERHLDKDGVPQPSLTFEEGEIELESLSFCAVKYDDVWAQSAHLRGPNFRIVDQDNVLNGPALHEWLTTKWTPKDLAVRETFLKSEQFDDFERSDEHLEALQAIEIEDRSNKKAGGEPLEDRVNDTVTTKAVQLSEGVEASTSARLTKPKLIRVTSAELKTQHAAWVASPTKENHDRLAELIHNFLCRKTHLAHKGDSLRLAGQSEDFQQEFLISILKHLSEMREAGEPVENPKGYIGTIWENARKGAFKKLKEQRKKEPSVSLDDRFIDEPDCELTLIDKQSYEDWARGAYASSVTEKSEEETLKDKKARFESLPDDLRDLAGLYYLQREKLRQRSVRHAGSLNRQSASN